MNESTFYAVSAQTLPVLALAAILELRWFLDGGVLVTTKGRRFGRLIFNLVAVLQGLGVILALLLMPRIVMAAASPNDAPGWLTVATAIAMQLLVATLVVNPAVVVMGALRHPHEPVPSMALAQQRTKMATAELDRLIERTAAIGREPTDRTKRNLQRTTRLVAVGGTVVAVVACFRRRR